MFYQVFSGNLTADATFNVFEENERSVINFTVAVNFNTAKKDENGNFVQETIFLHCSKWNKGTEPSGVLNYLNKGRKVLITSEYVQIKESENNGKIYQNINVFVRNIELLDYNEKQ